MKSTMFRLSLLTAMAAAAPLGAAPLISTARFQQGTAGYTGSFDRRIGPGYPQIDGSTLDTDAAAYFIDGGASALNDDGFSNGLIRFDGILGGSGIPAGAKVISADLEVRTTSSTASTNSQSGAAFNVYALNTSFDSSSTHDDASFSMGGNGIPGNVSAITGSFDDMTTADSIVHARVDRAVQSWVDGGTNYGLGIASNRSTDGWSPNTTGAATVTNRPKLNVNYTLDPLVDVVSYQQGVGGYTATADLRLDSDGTDQDGSTVEQTFVDGFDDTIDPPSADQSYLIRFNGLDLGNYQEIHKAELVLVSGFASTAADSPGPFHVHQVLRDWSTSSTYASFDSNGNPSVNGPAELEAGGVIAPAATTLTGMKDTEVVHIDVTSIVENWRSGQTNNGFYIGTPSPAEGGTNNGWQIFTSGAADASFRPELRIIGIRVPEPASAAAFAFGALCLSAVARRKRRG